MEMSPNVALQPLALRPGPHDDEIVAVAHEAEPALLERGNVRVMGPARGPGRLPDLLHRELK
eukprot:9421527-Lingulodinium_polyedra.AAC.1